MHSVSRRRARCQPISMPLACAPNALVAAGFTLFVLLSAHGFSGVVLSQRRHSD
ncbi:hypothetical protein OG563_40915 [Nocardia vinacea]|uniref:Uncharacterized protein n=1 Tax=Nocardia vinacea TaxID=96468 RepID=A0ABZ1YQK9_9NOCA|nr:hypothetical protein [Nocardia vinacea]